MIRVVRTPLPRAPRLGRRDAERAALLGLVTDIFGSGATLGHDPDGRPRIEGVDRFEGYISVTHCRSMAAIALSDHPVGIDIEEPRAALADTAHKWLRDNELATLPDNSLDTLLRLWTAKEAIYKLLSADLQPPGLIDIDLLDDAAPYTIVSTPLPGGLIQSLAMPKII